jgi:hypothetical protein
VPRIVSVAGLALLTMMTATRLTIRRGEPPTVRKLTRIREDHDMPDPREDPTVRFGCSDHLSSAALTPEAFSHELASMLQKAREAGHSSVVITAGELHRRVGRYPGRDHRMPICCRIMREHMGPSDAIVRQPLKGNGASLTIRYALARS